MQRSRLRRTPGLRPLVLATMLLSGCGGPQTAAPREAASGVAAQARWTARMLEALEAGEVERAHEAWRVLERDHAGDGLDESGRRLPSPLLAEVFVSDAQAAARRRREGTAGDPEGARRALALAREVRLEVAGLGADEGLAAREAATAAWIAPDRLEDLPGTLAPHTGPRVVLYADDFLLGEPWLLSVAGRWAREGRAGALRVGVVPILRGRVRVGIRRLRADAEEERLSIRERLVERDVALEPGELDEDEARRRLGLAAQEGAVLVADRAGRIVARLSGVGLDPRELEAVVQRVGSR